MKLSEAVSVIPSLLEDLHSRLYNKCVITYDDKKLYYVILEQRKI